MNKRRFRLSVGWCLLLILLLLPVNVRAEGDAQAMLYIERTDGGIFKFPITPGYPQLKYAFNALVITYLDPTETSRKIPQSDIKRIYTGFEATGIVTRTADADTFSEKVYSLSGRYVGNDSRAMDGQPKGVYLVKKGVNYKKIVKP